MVEGVGIILFLLIGFVLSLLGAGGSILAVPIFVYFVGVEPHLATSYSMFLVGISNWIGAIDSMRKKMVLYKVGLFFAIPGLLVTFTIRRFVLPYLPDIIGETQNMTLTKGTLIMLVFAIMMLVASLRAIFGKTSTGDLLPDSYNRKILPLQGAGVGLVTGFVGAGGGFLIIPALVFTSKIPMKYAVSTSLFIISITTSLGFLGDFNPSIHILWDTLLYYTAIAVTGVIIANRYKDRFSNHFLRLAFGYLILILAIFVIYTEQTNLSHSHENVVEVVSLDDCVVYKKDAQQIES